MKNTPKGKEKSLTVNLGDSPKIVELAGASDENLRTIAKILEIEIGHDRGSFVLKGQDTEVELAADLLKQLLGVLERGERIFPGDIGRAIKMLSGNRKVKLEDLFRDSVQVSGKRQNIAPKTLKQKDYLEAIRSHTLTFGIGPAGTGKTYLAMAMAVSALLRKDVKRVILCRPAVEAGEKLGFLPGDMAEKVNPYLRPLYDALYDMVYYDRATEMIEKGQIEVAPLAFMRGRTLSNAFIILDEAQNTTPEQMKMLLTRIGFGSTCIVTGDPTQVDLPRGQRSGLIDGVQVLRRVPEVAMIEFKDEDVVRHPLVSAIVRAYERYQVTP